VSFFRERTGGRKKIEVLSDLGLAISRIGQSATTLRRRGAAYQDRYGAEQAAAAKHTLYISTSRRRGCIWPTSSDCWGP